jgi:hypothetical protein
VRGDELELMVAEDTGVEEVEGGGKHEGAGVGGLYPPPHRHAPACRCR